MSVPPLPHDSVIIEAMSKNGETIFTQIIAVIATVSTIGQFFSGTFTVRQVWLMGTPGEFSPVPFLAAALGSSLWFLYGFLLQNATLMYTNVAGVTLNSFYVLVFYIYTPKRIAMSRQVFLVLFAITTITIYIRSFSLTDAEVARNNMGMICTVVSLFSCASPFVTLQHVIKTKSTESLPFPMILSVFWVCVLWWIYGVLIGDFYMQLTNFLGALISLVQLSLFCIYPSKHGRNEKAYQVLKSVT